MSSLSEGETRLMTPKRTTASNPLSMSERVARKMFHDPQWLREKKYGDFDLGEVCVMLGAKATSNTSNFLEDGVTRHEFRDQSAINIASNDGSWDIGFTADLCEDPRIRDVLTWEEDHDRNGRKSDPGFVFPSWYRGDLPGDVEEWLDGLERSFPSTMASRFLETNLDEFGQPVDGNWNRIKDLLMAADTNTTLEPTGRGDNSDQVNARIEFTDESALVRHYNHLKGMNLKLGFNVEECHNPVLIAALATSRPWTCTRFEPHLVFPYQEYEELDLKFRLGRDQASLLLLNMYRLDRNRHFLNPDEILSEARERIMQHEWSFYPLIEYGADLVTDNQQTEFRNILLDASPEPVRQTPL